jgi:hypothetical protein
VNERGISFPFIEIQNRMVASGATVHNATCSPPPQQHLISFRRVFEKHDVAYAVSLGTTYQGKAAKPRPGHSSSGNGAGTPNGKRIWLG